MKYHTFVFKFKTSKKMKTFKLLGHQYKKYGWMLLGLGVILWMGQILNGGDLSFLNTRFFTLINSGFLSESAHLSVNNVNLGNTLIGVLNIAGGLIIAFSKEKEEDEYINQLRLSSFQWAVLINYTILLVVFLGVFGLDFLYVLVGNMFTVLALFIIRFHYLLYRIRHEK